VRDDELRRLLTETNPWWKTATGSDPVAWAQHHRLLSDRAKHDLGYRTAVLADLAVSPPSDALVLLSGPRRVGKSVALIDLAAALCRRPEVDSRTIVHLPCDGMKSRDLRRAITIGYALTQSVDNPDERSRIWLIDEVGGVADWTATIKSARDQSRFGDDTVVLTSSSWSGDPAVGANLMAGRAGLSGLRRVRHLLPMTFRDYISATRPDLPCPPTVHACGIQAPDVLSSLTDVMFWVDDYDLAWQDYLTCGGFPRAVAEHTREGAVSDSYLRDLQAWLHADIDPEDGPQSTPLFLEAIAARASSPLNITQTAAALGHSRKSLTIRLNRLVHSFAGLWCPQRDDNGRVVANSQPKLYLTDPLLAWIPARLRSDTKPPDMTRLTESALGVALAAAIDQLEEGRWLSGDTIGYLRTSSGNEIDLAPVAISTAAGHGRTSPIESKWVDQGWRGEARVVEARYRTGVLGTKSILDGTNPVWAIPAPLLALLLG
jgi:predicted AAA+ superfamily ATPase